MGSIDKGRGRRGNMLNRGAYNSARSCPLYYIIFSFNDDYAKKRINKPFQSKPTPKGSIGEFSDSMKFED